MMMVMVSCHVIPDQKAIKVFLVIKINAFLRIKIT